MGKFCLSPSKELANGETEELEVCSIGPLTQLLISSLIPLNNNQTKREDQNSLSQDKHKTQKTLEDETAQKESFDWLKSRQTCRLENVLRKELRKLGEQQLRL